MSGSDYDQVFGSSPKPTTYAERVGKTEAVGEIGEKETAIGSGEYKAYGYMPSGNIGQTCDVQRWIDGTEVAEGIEFQYRFLVQVGYHGEEEIKLFLPDCIVVIEGKHLRDLRKRLARRQVTFIQQWSARVWPQAPAKGEAIISKIQVVRPNSD